MTPLSDLNGVLTSVVKGLFYLCMSGKRCGRLAGVTGGRCECSLTVAPLRIKDIFRATDGTVKMLLMGHLSSYLVCLCVFVHVYLLECLRVHVGL